MGSAPRRNARFLAHNKFSIALRGFRRGQAGEEVVSAVLENARMRSLGAWPGPARAGSGSGGRGREGREV